MFYQFKKCQPSTQPAPIICIEIRLDDQRCSRADVQQVSLTSTLFATMGLQKKETKLKYLVNKDLFLQILSANICQKERSPASVISTNIFSCFKVTIKF